MWLVLVCCCCISSGSGFLAASLCNESTVSDKKNKSKHFMVQVLLIQLQVNRFMMAIDYGRCFIRLQLFFPYIQSFQACNNVSLLTIKYYNPKMKKILEFEHLIKKRGPRSFKLLGKTLFVNIECTLLTYLFTYSFIKFNMWITYIM